MGIFTSRLEICDKCGKEALFDGPFSNCGCYDPKITKREEPKLSRADEEESKRIMKKIRKKIIK